MCLNLVFFSRESMWHLVTSVMNSSELFSYCKTSDDRRPSKPLVLLLFLLLYVCSYTTTFWKKMSYAAATNPFAGFAHFSPPAPRHPDLVRDQCGSCSSWPKHTILGKLSYSRTNSKWCLGSHSENLLLIWWTHLIIVAFV